MYYLSSITSKGQITIPKEIRDSLKLKPSQKVIFDYENKKLTIKPEKSFREIADEISKEVTNKADVLKARKYFEKNYERI